MPELAEVEYFRKRWNPGLGRKVVGVRLNPKARVGRGVDTRALAKALTDFAKDSPVIQFKGALVEGRAVDGAAIKEIAALPSREQLIAKLLFLLQAPIVRFVRVLAAVPQSFVTVIDQIRIQKDQQG